jgi:Flp pilus assembly protein TadG
MFPKNQPVPSLRKGQKHSKQQAAVRFALGWRDVINALRSAPAHTSARVPARAGAPFQPRSGARMQPTAQAVGKGRNRLAPAGRKIRTHAQALSAAIHALHSRTASPTNERNFASQLGHRLRSSEAAALIEFAVALPLLVVLVVGIFDFGGAFNLKQELNNAVREGARFGAAQPTNDISITNLKPPSVDAIRFLVDSYLQTAHINDCGLSTVAEPFQGGGMSWTYNASTGCFGQALSLVISREVPVQVTIGGATVTMLCTTVNISYPYQWHFNNVIQLLVPGANYTLGNIQSNATAVNMN